MFTDLTLKDPADWDNEKLTKIASPDNSSYFTEVTDSDTGQTSRVLQRDVPVAVPEAQDAVNGLVNKYWQLFSASCSDIGKSKGRSIRITLRKDAAPVAVPPYRTPLKLRDYMRKLIDDLVDANVLEKAGNTAFSAPCLLVPKKTELGMTTTHKCDYSAYRLVIDYRRLNQAIDEHSLSDAHGFRTSSPHGLDVTTFQRWTSAMHSTPSS